MTPHQAQYNPQGISPPFSQHLPASGAEYQQNAFTVLPSYSLHLPWYGAGIPRRTSADWCKERKILHDERTLRCDLLLIYRRSEWKSSIFLSEICKYSSKPLWTTFFSQSNPNHRISLFSLLNLPWSRRDSHISRICCICYPHQYVVMPLSWRQKWNRSMSVLWSWNCTQETAAFSVWRQEDCT